MFFSMIDWRSTIHETKRTDSPAKLAALLDKLNA